MSDRLSIAVQPDRGQINLRGDSGNTQFLDAAADALQQAVPVVPNTTSHGEHRVFWLGPNEWQIETAATATAGLADVLRSRLADVSSSVTDISGGMVTILMRGPGAQIVLAKGCTLDLYPTTFGTGQCAQTGLAKASVLICRIDDFPTYEIVVRRSFSDYLLKWLRHAGAEFGVQISGA